MVKLSDEKNNIYQTIFQSLPAAVAILDRQGTILDVNNRVNDWLGYQPGEIIGKKFYEISCLSKEFKDKAKEKFSRRMADRKIPTYDLEFIGKNRHRGFGRVQASLIKDKDGMILYEIVIITNISDITKTEQEQKRSEEKFRTIFENTNDEIIFMDKTGKIIDVNNRIKEVFGYTREEVIGKRFTDFNFFSVDELPKINKLFQQVIKKGQSGITNLQVRHKSGKIIFVEANYRMIKNGTMDGILATVRNITQEKQIEEELQLKSNAL